ncbi:protein of unknown function [Candidatus Hydrogenisulfobacillus filiaventi]|uniref:Uncharacterized protein n=1 Tax=Candidatus Hydrogenisulfobacillus filiaventi TaxID=2707344 RepID=A0A6F8ZFP4_9FIRM|nr:protein of unknown function [Candidatus Hydrogenisulfobacillus filiaventi]
MVAVFVSDGLVSRIQARGRELHEPAGAVFRAHARRLGPASGLENPAELMVWSLVPLATVRSLLLMSYTLAPDLVPSLQAALAPERILRFADTLPASYPAGR